MLYHQMRRPARARAATPPTTPPTMAPTGAAWRPARAGRTVEEEEGEEEVLLLVTIYTSQQVARMRQGSAKLQRRLRTATGRPSSS